jgi:hypothetical protein
MSDFNPKDHMIKLGSKDYLPVAARLLWLNEKEENFTIHTEIVKLEDAYAVCLAIVTINDKTNTVLKSARAYKREDKQHFPDFIEKASTGAVGRALGMLGFGTQFSGDEFDEMTPKNNANPRIVDTPQTTKSQASKNQAAQNQAAQNAPKASRNAGAPISRDEAQNSSLEPAGEALDGNQDGNQSSNQDSFKPYDRS